MKEALEISCSECKTRFRLWIPSEMVSEWEAGARVNCVRCGAQFLVKKGRERLEASLLAARQAPEKPAMVPPQKPERQPASEEPPVRAEEPKEESVLLIDDDRLSREMAEHTLKEIGYRLITVKNGAEALKILWKGNADIKLIVTDLYLKNPSDPESNIDGEELLKRAVDYGLNIPAIITTGKDIIDDLVLDPKWFDLHVKGFIQKGNPFWVEELKLKIKEVLYRG